MNFKHDPFKSLLVLTHSIILPLYNLSFTDWHYQGTWGDYSNLVVFTILGSPNSKKSLLCKTEDHLLRSPDYC